MTGQLLKLAKEHTAFSVPTESFVPKIVEVQIDFSELGPAFLGQTFMPSDDDGLDARGQQDNVFPRLPVSLAK